MEDLKLYIEEEGPAAAERVRAKILGAAAFAATASTAYALARERKLIRTVLPLTSNTAIAMTAFAVCQEGLRAARQGDDDGWNSFIAGGIAGATMTRLAYGRGFHLLGAVMWAPLCGSLHWLNGKLQPVAAIKLWLARHDLLDVPQHEQQLLMEQQQQQQFVELQPKPVPRHFEELSWREKMRAVHEIKMRELEQLHNKAQQEEQLTMAAETSPDKQQQKQDGTPAARKRWLF